MLSLFKKKPQTTQALNYAGVMVDMHSHVLPGIDDGAPTIEDSIFLIKRMQALGIKKIIATPHIKADYYRNNAETIGNALNLVKAELSAQNIDMTITAAAEHYFDETLFTRIEDNTLMLMPGSYVLFEFSFVNKPANYFELIQKFQEKGLKPILAHPERYLYMDMESLQGIRNWGCNLQVNTISLTGYYGKEIKKRAEELVDKEMIDFISSDMHHPRHAEALEAALKLPYLEKLLVDYPLKNPLLA
jgi:tyrosine-protein phosphatase YwqE